MRTRQANMTKKLQLDEKDAWHFQVIQKIVEAE